MITAMKKCILSTLLAFTLVCGAYAQQQGQQGQQGQNGVATVPDTGSTALLLGTGFLALVFASRRRIFVR
jgi:hypothetical protein